MHAAENHFKNSEHANAQTTKTMGDSPAQPPNKFPFKMCLFYLHGTINQIPFVKLSVWYLKKNNSNNKVYTDTHTNSTIAKSLFHAYKTAFTTMVFTHFLYSSVNPVMGGKALR